MAANDYSEDSEDNEDYNDPIDPYCEHGRIVCDECAHDCGEDTCVCGD